MKMPRISIIIPVYNTEQYLAKCIESVINQTYINLEILLVNDGSTDSSLDICNAYASNDSRVVVINKQNGGVSSARNSGLEVATGEYIGFVDSDDFLSPVMYEELLDAIQKNDADIAECGYCTLDMDYRITGKYEFKNSIIDGNYQCSYNYLANINTTNFNWNKLYKRFIFNDLRYPDLLYSEDYTINVKAFYKCNRKATISGCYYYYLKNEKSACNPPFTEAKLDVIKAGKEMLKYHQERFSDLCPFIALHIAELIISLYKELNQSDILNRQKYAGTLVYEYKQYYPLIEGDAYNMIRFKKIHISLWLFSKGPSMYCLIEKVLKRLKSSFSNVN